MAQKTLHGSQKKLRFSCPVSTHLAWEWGLIYKECPVAAGERDMIECRNCQLRGNVLEELKKEKARPKRGRDEHDNKGKPGSKKPSRKDHKEQQK